MNTGIEGLLSFLAVYSKLAKGSVETAELQEAYCFLKEKVTTLRTITGRVPEGSEDPKDEGKEFPLAKYFTEESPSRLDMAIAVDAFIHKAHAEDSDILGKAFECDLNLASDISLPLLDSFAETTPTNPVRKQVRGYDMGGDRAVLLKADDGSVIIAGYASVAMVDKEQHLIPRPVLAKAFTAFMAREGRKNIMFAHTNVQVGEVLPEWQSPITKRKYISKVDEKGLFIVARVWGDTTVGARVVNEITKGGLKAFSISGLGGSIQEKQGYKEVQALELYEITVCEAPVNPGAFFQMVKGIAISFERVSSSFQKSIPLGLSIKVNGSIDPPLGFRDTWLKRALEARIGRHPSLAGSYELELRPCNDLAGGIRLSDYSLTLVGEGSHPVASYNYDILVKHSKSTLLGLTLHNVLSKSLPSGLKGFVEFVFDEHKTLSVSHVPLMYLVAKKVQASE